MRLRSNFQMIVVSLAVLGLGQQADSQTAQRAASSGRQQKEPAPVPVPIKEGKVALTPKNTTVQFVGTHVGEEPNPRIGYFTKFAGDLAIDEATNALEGATLQIETPSLITPIGRLTGHLQSPDFFDVRQFPEATFKSTKIEATDTARGKYKLTGELTIREVTKPISFPVTVTITDAGAVLASKFKLKRSDYGMTFGPDRVVDEVAMTVTVGKPAPKVAPQ
jgi:polyisoprenoid-binding protein YceI